MMLGKTRAFTFPEGVEARPIRSPSEGRLCVECEGRPAMIEVRRPDETSARPLCGQCAMAEFAPPVLTEEALVERTVRQFEEAERTATPEQLGRMAEFHQQYWDGLGTPMPAALAAMVARHLGSARPPAEPVPGLQVTDEDVRVARLALMVMRGAICARQVVVSGERCIIRPGPQPVSYETAAERLARLPKPLECRARAEGEIMTVLCREITEPNQLAGLQVRARHQGRQRLGPDVPMVCVGFEETMWLTVGERERLWREYEMQPHSTSASPPGDYLSQFPREVRAAVAGGAQLLMSCGIGDRARSAEQEGRVIVVRDGRSYEVVTVYALTANLDGVCEACRSGAPRWVATDVRSEPWQDRRLCDACVVGEIRAQSLADVTRLWEGTRRLSEKGQRSAAEDVAQQAAWLGRWWKVLPMPGDIAAVFEQLRTEGA